MLIQRKSDVNEESQPKKKEDFTKLYFYSPCVTLSNGPQHKEILFLVINYEVIQCVVECY
jgi:hypothetical protein